MDLLLVRVKTLEPNMGELAQYSEWGGVVLEFSDRSPTLAVRCLIAPPPNFEEGAVDVWLSSELLVFLKGA